VNTRGFLFFLLTLICHFNAKPQGFGIGGSFYHGFVIPHNTSMRYLVTGYSSGGGIDVVFRGKSEKPWQKDYKNPTFGLSANFFSWPSHHILGWALGIQPFVDFRLHQKRNRELILRHGTGIGYISAPFQRTENHKNNVMSSHLNGNVTFRLGERFYYGNGAFLEGGIHVTHFSNGAVRMPNLGINYISAYFSCVLGKNLKNNQPLLPDSSRPEIPKKSFWIFQGMVGLNEANPPGGKKHYPWNLSSVYLRNFSKNSSWFAGLELLNSPANIARLENDSVFISYGENFQAGIKGGYEQGVGNLGLYIEKGIYVIDKHRVNGLFFHRLGIRWYFSERFMCSFNLKSHWASADGMEIGFAYKLKAGK
jgi:hypothetical protein